MCMYTGVVGDSSVQMVCGHGRTSLKCVYLFLWQYFVAVCEPVYTCIVRSPSACTDVYI